MSQILSRRSSALVVCIPALIGSLTPRASAAPEQAPPEHPFLSYSHGRDWTLNTVVRIRSAQETSEQHVQIVTWNFQTVAIIFPLMEQTSSSNLDIETAAGELSFNDVEVSDEFTVISGYHSGQKYAKFDATNIVTREMELEIEYLARSFRTEFDEAKAQAIAWPMGEWPEGIAETLEPAPFIESYNNRAGNIGELDNLLRQWTNGRDPKKVPPLTLAKWFAGRVVEHVQPTSDGLNRGRRYLGFEGFKVQGAPETARTRKGSPFDTVALLAAMYKRAGLPARVVIGYLDPDDDDPDEADEHGASRLRAYVEFFLYDEPNERGGWIPVDVVRMREKSSRAPTDLTKPWRYFGTHDELDRFIPMSFHFHPPTTVQAYGSPAMWGWLVTPVTPQAAYQYLNFNAYRTPMTSSGPVLPGER
ncbi:MAG: transglutaminase-like domain-containing protein [Planctomycetota bacterium]